MRSFLKPFLSKNATDDDISDHIIPATPTSPARWGRLPVIRTCYELIETPRGCIENRKWPAFSTVRAESLNTSVQSSIPAAVKDKLTAMAFDYIYVDKKTWTPDKESRAAVRIYRTIRGYAALLGLGPCSYSVRTLRSGGASADLYNIQKGRYYLISVWEPPKFEGNMYCDRRVLVKLMYKMAELVYSGVDWETRRAEVGDWGMVAEMRAPAEPRIRGVSRYMVRMREIVDWAEFPDSNEVN